MKGKIRKITLTNFITYEHLELIPGQNMNLIIGPNGSGKSSILCGMCLGLAGKPSSIGRVTKLSDYIKVGCNAATIEIELHGTKGAAIITRIINRGGSDSSGGTSNFAINGKTSNQKEVNEFVKSMNIQMDNLCQFLSQERVQDFTKMNAKELLINTEKTVGSSEMYENHQRLITLCKSGGGQEKSVSNMEEGLIREKSRLEQLEVRMQGMRERVELVKKLTHVKAKIPWVEYNDQVESMKEIKEDRLNAKGKVTAMEKALKPLEKATNELNERLKLLKAEARKKTSGPAGGIKKYIEDEDKVQREIQRKVGDLREIEKQKEKFQSELALLESKIASNQEKLEELESSFDPAENKKELEKLNTKTRELSRSIESEQVKLSTIKRRITDANSAIRDIDYDIKDQTNLSTKRVSELIRLDKLAYDATIYLKRELVNYNFVGEVYPSIVLEINAKDKRANKYLNLMVSRRDKVAFLCEKSEDFNFLFMHLKNKFGKGVNMLSQDKENLDLQHPMEVSQLKNLGFDDYLSNLVNCPQAIFNFLCKSYRLHCIPVAFKDGQVKPDEASKYFNSYFIGDTHYKISTSRYTNEKSSRTTPIHAKQSLLDISVDHGLVSSLNKKREQKVLEIEELKSELQQAQSAIECLEREQEPIRKNIKDLRIQETQINDLKKQLSRNMSSKNAKLEQQGNFDSNKEKLLQGNKVLFKNVMQRLGDFKKHLKKCYEYDIESDFANMEVKALTRKHQSKFEELDEKKKEYMDFLRTVKNLEAVYQRKKQESEDLRKAAEEAIGCKPNDPKFKKFQEIFSKLPSTLLELDDMKTEMESRLEFMDNSADGNVAELLDVQKTKVAKIEKDLVALRKEVASRKAEMDKLKATWVPALHELADRICVKFERLFNYMNCEGTVKLIEGNPEVPDDYENFGLSIQVSFRAGESMQELGGTQSGGERSVSTAIYLLALQELTEVPFRCLDEINQGMDATNERRIMELMMKMSGGKDSCQYFLVSPKLLANLEYVNSCRVLCVQQPMRMDTTKWSMHKFILDKQIAAGEKKQKLDGNRPQDNEEDSE
ncbi:Hypothetical predicted protein [Cloeon dipterum]|uniref:Structural maintenance of chromosomes protein 5 n=1 Tax=Cloeon dipterum TaxID=197152 RepID=A0A8S1DAS5_9INSE|nr:Hypothetical predicted protein [Cloeon dipterum]